MTTNTNKLRPMIDHQFLLYLYKHMPITREQYEDILDKYDDLPTLIALNSDRISDFWQDYLWQLFEDYSCFKNRAFWPIELTVLQIAHTHPQYLGYYYISDTQQLEYIENTTESDKK